MTYSQHTDTAYWTTKSVGPFLRNMHEKVERWCNMHFGYNNYCTDGLHYSFRNKRDADEFAQRWL